MGHLRDGHAAEHLGFDDARAARVERAEPLECVVEREQLERRGRPVPAFVVERTHCTAAAGLNA